MERATEGSGLFRFTRDRILAMAWLLGACVLAAVVPALITRPWQIDGRTYFGIWTGASLYELPPNTQGAYLYSPVFAQLFTPFTHLPWSWFGVLWPAAAACAYIWLVKPIGWLWGVPILTLGLEDATIGNISWLLALTCALGLRRPWIWCVAILTKITPAVGIVYFIAQRNWRALAGIASATLLAVGVSYLLDPGLWSDWLWFLAEHRSGDPLLPLRTLSAAAIAFVAARTSRPWLIPFAILLASPVLMVYSLGVLAAVPRLLPAEFLARARQPFGPPVAFARRVLDLPLSQ